MRMWEILESYKHSNREEYPIMDERRSMGMRGSSSVSMKDRIDDAYKCGYEDGYKKAMKEVEEYLSKK